MIFPKLQEVRSTLANPAKWLVEWVNGGSESKAGIKVNRDSAMTVSAFFDGVRIIANAVSTMPLILYKRNADGSRDRATNHPMYKIAHSQAFIQPDRRMSASRFRQTLQGHLVTHGNAYAQVDMAGSGQVKGLYPLHPDRITIETKGGKLEYRYRLNSGPDKVFADWELWHLPGIGYDGIKGYSLLTLAREGIGLSLAMEEYGSRFFSNGARPSGIIKYPGKLDDVTRNLYKKDLKEKHGELGKSHELLFLENGFEYQQLSITPEDSQFLESRKFDVVEIARWLNLPPYMLKHTDAERITNVEHRGIELIEYSFLPWLVLWEDEMSLMFLNEREREEYYFEFMVQGLLRADAKSRNESYEIQRRNGIISANDWRRMENMNPIPGAEGDQLLIPVNMMPADKAGDFYGGKTAGQDNKARSENRGMITPLRQLPVSPLLGGNDRNAVPVEQRAVARNRLSARFYGLFKDAAGKVVWRERREIEDLMKKHITRADNTGTEHRAPTKNQISQFEAALENLYATFGDYVARNFGPVIDSYAGAIYDASADEAGGDETSEEEKQKWTDGYKNITVARYIDNSFGELKSIIRDTNKDDLADAITTRLDEWDEKLPDKVAERETVDGRSAFAELIFLAAGFDLIWRAQGSSCPYCMQLDGKRVGRVGSFVNAGDEIDPGDDEHPPMTVYETKRHPQLHRGCDCIIVAG